MVQSVPATVSLLYCFNKHSTAPRDKELLWPNFSYLGQTSSGIGPLKKWYKPLPSAQAPELRSVTLESETQGRDSDETPTRTSSGFSSTPSAQRQAHDGQTYDNNFQELTRPGFKWEAERQKGLMSSHILYLETICQVLERQARAKPSCAKDIEISP